MTFNFWRAVRKHRQMVGDNFTYAWDADKHDHVYTVVQPERPCVHFVGFKGDEYTRAVRIFGRPDFIHRLNDQRLLHGGEKDDADIVVYANGAEAKRYDFSFNDSDVGLKH